MYFSKKSLGPFGNFLDMRAVSCRMQYLYILLGFFLITVLIIIIIIILYNNFYNYYEILFTSKLYIKK